MVDFTNKQNSGAGSMPIPNAATPKQAQQDASGVTELLINYNEKFKSASPAKYRDKEIFTVISHLMMSQKSCSLLIGAPGTGKTKIVEEIARLIAQKSPYTATLNDYVIYELPLTNLMAGTSFRGQLEEKLKDVISFCETEKVILFIDEVHQLCERGSADNVSQMLKPAMARGSIKMIGATTLQESKSLLDDPAFNRRFNKVQVCELSTAQTQEIIQDVYMPVMAKFYGIGFGNNVAQAIVKAAEKSKTITCHRPDNAITLLDQICANTVLTRNFNIATCTDDALKQAMIANPVVVNIKHIEDFHKNQGFTLPQDFSEIKSKIFFRDDVIDRAYDILDRFVKINAAFPDEKPFVMSIEGEACSGKSTIAKLIAKSIDEQPVSLDLADYLDHASLNRIIGSPIGYVGSDSKKEMPFDIVESNPQKVIILDNIDKAHPSIQEFFKAALDTGLIKYADNRLVDISKCIVITTASKIQCTSAIGFSNGKDAAQKAKDSRSISIKKLNHDELIQGADRLISSMIADLKAAHSKYVNVPDRLDLTDEEKAEIKDAKDMGIVSKKKVLEIM